MAEIKIKNLTGTALTFDATDYTAVDGDTGTRKMLFSTLQSLIRNDLTDAELAVLDGCTATATELNKLDDCTATTEELNYLAGITPGDSAASKAVVLDANQDGKIGRNLDIIGNLEVTGTLKAGASELASTVMAGNLDLNENDLIIDLDGDTKLYASSDDIISLNLGGSEVYRFDASAFGPSSYSGASLGGSIAVTSGTQANPWDDLNLTGVINMAETADPGGAVIDGSFVLYMDSATGDLKVRIRHDGTSGIATLVDYSEL